MAHHVDELHADKIRVRDVATLERIHQHDNEDLIRGLFSFSPEACETLARAQLVDVPGVPGAVMPKRYLRKSLVVREDEVVCVKTIRVNERADRVLLPDADRALLTNRYGTSVIYQDAAPAMFKIGLLTTCSVGHATCLTKMCVEAKGKQGRTYPVHVTRAIYVRNTNEWLDLYAYELARDTVPLDISLVDLTKDLTKKTARLVGLARHVIEDYSMPPFTDQGRAPVWYDPVTGKSTISSIDDVEVFYSNNTTSR